MIDRLTFEGYCRAGDKKELFRKSLENRVAAYNLTTGKDDGTGLDCIKCRNRGDVAFATDTGTFCIRKCDCAGMRLTIKRLQRVGLWEKAQKCKLRNFETSTPSQIKLKDTVQHYIADRERQWLALCGQSGSGKTHLCTAAFVKLCYDLGAAGEYLVWTAGARKLKAAALDDEDGLLEKFKRCELLYIDDLFKGRQGAEPSDADIRLAFELLDYRYNQSLPTIISSEFTFAGLLNIDQAIASRIKEKCGPYLVSIAPDASKNYRLST